MELLPLHMQRPLLLLHLLLLLVDTLSRLILLTNFRHDSTWD
jgi:hypothetical protein